MLVTRFFISLPWTFSPILRVNIMAKPFDNVLLYFIVRWDNFVDFEEETDKDNYFQMTIESSLGKHYLLESWFNRNKIENAPLRKARLASLNI